MRLNVRGSVGHVPGQPAVLDIDYANLAVNGSISSGSPNITMNVSNPGTVTPGMGVWDITASKSLGTVASYTGTALVLQANASNNGSGSSDVLAFLAQPPATVGFGTWLGACNTAVLSPCLALGVLENGTPTAAGAIKFTLASAAPGGAAALPAGTALGDGLFAPLNGTTGTGTITEVGSAGDSFGTNIATIAPSATCPSSGTHCGSSGTSIALPAPASGGQWAVGMYLYDTAATPCIATDVYDQISTYITALGTGTGGAGTYTISHAILSNCDRPCPHRRQQSGFARQHGRADGRDDFNRGVFVGHERRRLPL